ncbi:MAG: non-homologous end-joining DNA ligase [Proteobacteria bacterium]|nr:non-homologous end-joining DNA ligase [Pseudomonadota bacterium]
MSKANPAPPRRRASRQRRAHRPAGEDALGRYAAKRSFALTPEPPAAAASAPRAGPLLFVVQKHAARQLHYDFRLELDGVLKSWAVPKGPSSDPADRRMAVAVEDHPFDYASFEGVIPQKQYGAGNVVVWDCGVYSPDEGGHYDFADRAAAQQRVRAELAAGKLSLFLRGEKLKGSFALVRTRTASQWLLLKHRDRFAQTNTVLAQHHSVLSGLSLEEIGVRGPPPRLPAAQLTPAGPSERVPEELAPMLAHSTTTLRSDPQWRYEPKLDGYRCIAFIDGTRVRLQSRRGIDITALFPEVAAELAAQAVESMVLDGEIVALDADGRPSFHVLQNRAQLRDDADIARAARAQPVALVCFDLLHFAGLNLRGAPYAARRRYLAQCLLPSPHIQLIHGAADAGALYDAALAHGFEGIVGKRIDSPYLPGERSAAWLKCKSGQTAEFLVGGYTRGKGARAALGALLLGYRAGRALRYAGHVGSGLDEAALALLGPKLSALRRATCPFDTPPDLHRPTTWVEPRLVVEVAFSEWTPSGSLRAPVFRRLRDDIDAARVRRPQPAHSGARARQGRSADKVPGAAIPGAASTNADPRMLARQVLEQLDAPGNRLDLSVGTAKIRLTHLDRIYWPAPANSPEPPITKRDLLRYLASVAHCMLPHLADRPLTMIRMPEGIAGERFFQKHWAQALPDFVDTIEVYSDHKEESHRYLLANNLPTLLWLGQVGTLEFHVWHSRARAGADAPRAGTDYASSLAAMEASVLNRPDYLVFDIDPYIYSGKEAPGAEPELNRRGFAVGRRVAFWLRDLLQEMSLQAVVKTSGKTGLHVFVPIERTVTFDEARHLCETIGRHVMRQHPKEITMDWAVEKRTGRIFIDYNMNVRGKTLNVAYSPRGVAGAPVSMPLTWEELEAAEPTDFTIRNAPARLVKTGDRWHDVLSVKQSLTLAFGIEREK